MKDAFESPQRWDAARYARNASFVAELGRSLLSWLTVPETARLLDLGCGDGALTAELVQRGHSVVAIDASASMVEAARARGIDAHVMDGHHITLPKASFDVVFSNATLHWLTRPREALEGVFATLKPGGEFVAEMGGHGNTRTVLAAIVAELEAHGATGTKSPWYFPTPAEYATELERAGFRVEQLAYFDRPTTLPGDVTQWLDMFGGTFLSQMPDERRGALLDAVRTRLRPTLQQPDGTWVLDYVRLRFRARKPLV